MFTSTPEPGVPAEAKDKRLHWELIGAVGPKQSKYPSPPPFEGGRALIELCKERRPCAAERWRSENGESLDMVLIERTYHFQDDRKSWPAQWVSITGTLRACLGDPLSIPPTDDPESIRSLMTSKEKSEWWLHFSGNNTCGLEGQIRLNTQMDEVDLSALKCEGKRWREGGRECARSRLTNARTK